MGEIGKYNELTPVAYQWLRRLQAYNTKILDKTSMELIELFVSTFGPDKIKELQGLGELKLSEANRLMTTEFQIQEIGVNPGKNPSREIERIRKTLDVIKDNPYISYETIERGKKCYHTLPLIKYAKVEDDGRCTIIYNDTLRYLFFPETAYAYISLPLLKEIKKQNLYASIIYEEACSYENMFNHGKDPFFKWSLQDVREKFSFDKMTDFSKDMTSYVPYEVKKMRPNNLIGTILKPALSVLQEFYSEGKIRFWLELEINSNYSTRAGRPPKDLFRFVIRKSKTEEEKKRLDEQLELFDTYDEMDTLYFIKKQLQEILSSKGMINKIIEQLKNNEQIGTYEEVLTKIKTKRCKYDKKNKKERASIILSILGKDHHLGDSTKFITSKEDDSVFWPDSIEERIKLMTEASEIKDYCSDHFSLSSQEVDYLLVGDFYQNCIKTKRLANDWNNAVNRFYSWLKLLGIKGPLNNVTYGNRENRQQSADAGFKSVIDFFNAPAEELDR